MPSFNLYRGALLVMLVGTAVAVFLLVRPPGETKGAPPVVVGKTTATPASGTPQPTVPAQTPQSTVSETPASETPASAGTPTAGTPTVAVTESPFGEYVVVAGDTLFDIANANLPPGDDPVSFAKAIATLNGLDYDAPVLPIGKKLLLPKPSR
jgi:LysM repeat protein